MTTRIAIAGLDKELVQLILETPEYECVGVFDKVDIGLTLGCPWLGEDSEWGRISGLQPDVRVLIGVDMPVIRRKLAAHFGESTLTGIRSKSSSISKYAQVCESAVIQNGVKVTSDVHIGYCCKLNHDVVIHHDCRVGDYCTISPGARLLGNVILDECVFIGAGAIVLPHVLIGKGATVGAGAVVAKDIEAGDTVAGVPAKILSSRLEHQNE